MWEKEERGERLKETEGRQKKTEGVKEVTLGKFHRGGGQGEGGGAGGGGGRTYHINHLY